MKWMTISIAQEPCFKIVNPIGAPYYKYDFFLSLTVNKSRLLVIIYTLSGETLRAKLSLGKTIRWAKFSSLSPDEKFRPIKAKVSYKEVQVNLREKQVI